MMKVAVISAMTGDFDNITPPSFQDSEFDYFFFTDTDKHIQGYKTIVLPEGDRLDKKVKILPFEFLDGYDVFIWHDANMHQVSSFKPLIASVNKPMGFLNHPSRKCVTEEIEAIAYFKKANVRQVCEQVQDYLSEGMPIGFGLWECGVSVRFNTPEVQEFCRKWYEETQKSPRDQLSFAYTMWKTKMDINWIHSVTYRGRELQYTQHKAPLKTTYS